MREASCLIWSHTQRFRPDAVRQTDLPLWAREGGSSGPRSVALPAPGSSGAPRPQGLAGVACECIWMWPKPRPRKSQRRLFFWKASLGHVLHMALGTTVMALLKAASQSKKGQCLQLWVPWSCDASCGTHDSMLLLLASVDREGRVGTRYIGPVALPSQWVRKILRHHPCSSLRKPEDKNFVLFQPFQNSF